MNKKFVRRIAAGTMMTLAIGTLLSQETNTVKAASGENAEVKKIIVGIGNAFPPFCYIDENEELAGYEYDVLKQVDEALPQYEFQYEPTEFKNLFVGLDTDAYDLIAQNMGWNEERAAKYLYGDVSNFNAGTGYVIEALPGRTDIQSVDDLQGKTVGVSATFNGAYLLQAYNEKHGEDEQINIVYSDATTEERWSDIVNGVIDATITTVYGHDRNVAAYGDIVAAYGKDEFSDYTQEKPGRYLYNYGDEQLKTDIDQALQPFYNCQ